MIKQISNIIKRSGKSDKWIALSIGVSVTTVSMLRRCAVANVRLETANKIIKLFGYKLEIVKVCND